jgi:PhoPQ-activated pathogenicity-related protein
MLNVTITVSGFTELQAALLSGGFAESINNGLSEAASELEGRTTTLCPVDTGDLQASISITSDNTGIHAEATEDYASYVDEGTSKMDEQPFFTEPITDYVENDLAGTLLRSIDAYLSTI